MKKYWTLSLIPLLAPILIAQFGHDNEEGGEGWGVPLPSWEQMQEAGKALKGVHQDPPVDAEITDWCIPKRSRWTRFRFRKKKMGGWQCLSLEGVDVIDNPVKRTVMQKKRWSHDFYLRNTTVSTMTAKVDINITPRGAPPITYSGDLFRASTTWFTIPPGEVVKIGTLTETSLVPTPPIDLRIVPPLEVPMRFSVREVR